MFLLVRYNDLQLISFFWAKIPTAIEYPRFPTPMIAIFIDLNLYEVNSNAPLMIPKFYKGMIDRHVIYIFKKSLLLIVSLPPLRIQT